MLTSLNKWFKVACIAENIKVRAPEFLRCSRVLRSVAECLKNPQECFRMLQSALKYFGVSCSIVLQSAIACFGVL